VAGYIRILIFALQASDNKSAFPKIFRPGFSLIHRPPNFENYAWKLNEIGDKRDNISSAI
jgi:hypothetical protein